MQKPEIGTQILIHPGETNPDYDGQYILGFIVSAASHETCNARALPDSSSEAPIFYHLPHKSAVPEPDPENEDYFIYPPEQYKDQR